KRDFYVIGIVIPEYIPFQQNYGTEAGEILLKRIGEILRDVCGRDSVIGRLIDSNFTIHIYGRSARKSSICRPLTFGKSRE
ncbi:MAG: diguanylate cyclase domain-containing protein, partial [Eubacterium sp.]